MTTVKENKGVLKTQQSGIPSFPLADQVVQRGPFVYRNREKDSPSIDDYWKRDYASFVNRLRFPVAEAKSPIFGKV